MLIGGRIFCAGSIIINHVTVYFKLHTQQTAVLYWKSVYQSITHSLPDTLIFHWERLDNQAHLCRTASQSRAPYEILYGAQFCLLLEVG